MSPIQVGKKEFINNRAFGDDMPKFLIITAGFGNPSFELPDGNFTIGRGLRNHVELRDPSVSAEHCELLIFGREVIVRERGSRNGTFVDGVRVKHQGGVNHNQVIRLGRIELRVEVEPPDWDVVTAQTASEDLRQFERNAAEKRASPPAFPITFAPETDPSGDASDKARRTE
jgi:pSer/pThr/pTyr-binding forkhead associated (FHA) protein